MNEVEKRVHQLLFENHMSIWISGTEREVSNRTRMGKWSCSRSQLFMGLARASVLPPSIHTHFHATSEVMYDVIEEFSAQ